MARLKKCAGSKDNIENIIIYNKKKKLKLTGNISEYAVFNHRTLRGPITLVSTANMGSPSLSRTLNHFLSFKMIRSWMVTMD